ncbi:MULTISPECIES: DMT family transporter [Moorena]|uniref:Drug/metabolite permease, DMT superfamily n=1 Tax=Moorena producens 3L TaxID=489825 RepID=F4Y3H3_9CYAN|nr:MULTISPECIES: DMT family transporter [Moorena]EGJ28649.1 drug/metabolite permease, DMT superfamily [Moorena producens 3L]NEP68907.1 DMT family transporter [Moorena sp. SIO3A5]NER91465.1 DMT family transporter [Moorena sp. SIO3A2]OLT63855.1 permease [Moorena producens 3L]
MKAIVTEYNREQTSELLPILLLVIALLALSITAILIRFSLQEISANATVFNRLWIATLVFGLWNGFSQVRTQTSQKNSEPQSGYKIVDILLLVGVAISHLSGRFLWTWSLTQTSVANSNVLGSITPFFATIGGWLVFKQRFDRRFLIGLLLALLGATTIQIEDLLKSSNNFIGDTAALASSVFYAVNFLLLEQLRTKFSVEGILIWRCALGTLFMIPVVLIFSDQIFPISWSGWLAVISLALVCEAVGHGLVVYSLKNFSSGFVSLVLLLDPIVGAILAWILFSESLSILNILAFAVIIEGIYLAKTGKGADKPSIKEQNT